MIKNYNFNYNNYDAEVCFSVDTDKFKSEDAKILLEFFTWIYDEDSEPIDELMKKYAIKAILIATAENYNESDVKRWFKEQEGFLSLDGSQGVELTYINPYYFNEEFLDIEIKTE